MRDRPWVFARALLAAAGVLLAMSGCGGGGGGQNARSQGNAASGAGTPKASSLQAQLPASIRSAGAVRVASDLPFPPYEFYDSQHQLTGFEVDLAHALGQRLGVRFPFAQQSFDGLLPALQAHKYDVAMSAISDTADREKVVDFVDYANDAEAMLVPKGNPRNIRGVDGFCGNQVAAVKGSVDVQRLATYSSKCTKAGHRPIQVLTYPSDPAAELAVQSGKAAAVVNDGASLAWVAKTVDGGDAFTLVPIDDPSNVLTPIGIAVPKDQSQLRDALRRAVTQVMSSGEYARLIEKYGLKDFARQHVAVDAAAG